MLQVILETVEDGAESSALYRFLPGTGLILTTSFSGNPDKDDTVGSNASRHRRDRHGRFLAPTTLASQQILATAGQSPLTALLRKAACHWASDVSGAGSTPRILASAS